MGEELGITTLKPLQTSGSDKLDRQSLLPLHRQLYSLLREKIDSKEWQIGYLIPREIDLMEQFELSRYPVRQALEQLVQEGYLLRTKKRGTVVSRPKVEQNLSKFYSFARDMEAKGFKPVSFVLGLEQVIPDEETARILNYEEGSDMAVYNLRRLRVVENEPWVIESSFLAFDHPVELYHLDWRIQPLYEILENEFAIKVESAREFLEPVNLEPKEAQLLGISPGSAAFKVERHTYDNTLKVFERRISLIRGDRYRFCIDLHKVELLKSLN